MEILKGFLMFVVGACVKILPKRIIEILHDVTDDKTCENSPIEGIMLKSIEQSPKNELEIVPKLVASYKDAQKMQSEVAKPYLPGADWKKLLESEWTEYYSAIEREDFDVIALLLRNLFRNAGITGFWGSKRVFERFATLSRTRRQHRERLMQRQFNAWRSALPEASVAELDAPRVGNPWGYIIDGCLLYEPVFEYYYQANYFSRLLSEVSHPIILEIGGGFGGLGYHIMKCIPNATYIGIDLPENILIQSYYLSSAFPEHKILTYDRNLTLLKKEIIRKYNIILMPNFFLPKIESAAADLVVNAKSLSEMPFDTIEEYFQQIGRLTHLFFFHENLFKNRRDSLHGIPSCEFPVLHDLVQIAESESRWPRYQATRPYPCHENLYIHRSVLRR